MSSEFEIKELDTFRENLRKYFARDEEKIRRVLFERLRMRPDHYQMLEGAITVAGLKFVGLRHIKIGVRGYRGGSVTLFRICEECLRERYYEKTIRCQFCDENKPKRIVLFNIQPRKFGYG